MVKLNTCIPAPNQLDLVASYQAKLQYDFFKNQLDLNRNQMMLEQRKAYETEIQKVKIQYRTFLDMLSYSICEDSQGNMIFAITDPSNGKIAAKPLLNVCKFQSVLYFAYQPELHFVLGINWEGSMNGTVYFKKANQGISPQNFLKNLKARGVLFLVSGRTEKKAAEALLAYSFQHAETVELPYFRGWNFMSEGSWHFADERALIMKEIEKNAV